MKKLKIVNLTSIFLFLFFQANSQVAVQGDLFLEALIERGVDNNGDGQMQEAAALAVTNLHTASVDKVDLRGTIPLQEFRTGFESKLILLARNTGTEAFTGTLTLHLPKDLLTYVSSDHMPSSIDSKAISWEVQNLLPSKDVSIKIALRLNSPMDAPLHGAGNIKLCMELTNADPPQHDVCIEDLSIAPVDENSLKVFPNPSTGNLTVQSASGSNKIEQLEWIDVNGRLLGSDRVHASRFDYQGLNMAPGIYFLKITTAEFVQTQRVVIHR